MCFFIPEHTQSEHPMLTMIILWTIVNAIRKKPAPNPFHNIVQNRFKLQGFSRLCLRCTPPSVN